VATFLVVAMILTATNQPSHAQTAANEERITLSPAVVRPELKSASTNKGKLTVINNGSISYTFLMYARPFSVSGEQYDPNFTKINEQTEAYQWVQFKQTEMKLKPGQRTEVEYTVSVPNSAAAGGHYAVLFAETQPPDETGNVTRKKRVGALLYMTVDGDINRSGSLESWSAPLLQTQRPVSSTLRLKNDGNIHYQANLKVKYTNIFNKKRFELNQELLILPDSIRRIPIEWQDAPYAGIYKASGQVSYLDRTEELPVKYVILLPIPIIAGAAIVIATGLILGIRKCKKSSKIGKRKR